MNVEITRNKNKVEVRIIGRLDTLASTEFNTAIAPYINEQGIEMTINCAEMMYIASSGLRSLLSLYKSLTAHSSSMVLVEVQPMVMQVFTITGFIKFLTIK